MSFDQTVTKVGPPVPHNTWQATYSDEFAGVDTGNPANGPPSSDNIGGYPSPNRYVGTMSPDGGRVAHGGHIDATFDYTTSLLSGNMSYSEGYSGGSFLYACTFEYLKLL
jgi:hypothetical protein